MNYNDSASGNCTKEHVDENIPLWVNFLCTRNAMFKSAHTSDKQIPIYMMMFMLYFHDHSSNSFEGFLSSHELLGGRKMNHQNALEFPKTPKIENALLLISSSNFLTLWRTHIHGLHSYPPQPNPEKKSVKHDFL